jgi:hypothetical protein
VILFSVQRSKLKRKNGDRIYRMNMIFRKAGFRAEARRRGVRRPGRRHSGTSLDGSEQKNANRQDTKGAKKSIFSPAG